VIPSARARRAAKHQQLSVWASALIASATLTAQNPALWADPPVDPKFPAAMFEIAVPSHGSQLFGVFYIAAGDHPHPSVILLHGFPGYEQNLDLGQALRRAGYNVLAVHYRGSWGVKGDFSLTHAIEDADAQVDWITSPGVAAKYHVDPARVTVIGHSMGGFMAANAAAQHSSVHSIVMISAWDISQPYAGMQPQDQARAAEIFARDVEPADMLPLSGTTVAALAAEAFAHRGAWDFVKMAPALGQRPVLLITANDGSGPDSSALLKSLQAVGNRHSEHIKMKTDHPFSDHRIELESAVLKWLSEQR
jgi:pimeloyl-ACP methyl ester carboxylesterase